MRCPAGFKMSRREGKKGVFFIIIIVSKKVMNNEKFIFKKKVFLTSVFHLV